MDEEDAKVVFYLFFIYLLFAVFTFRRKEMRGNLTATETYGPGSTGSGQASGGGAAMAAADAANRLILAKLSDILVAPKHQPIGTK